MTKFNVGDKVRIKQKKDFDMEIIQKTVFYTDEFDDYCGQIATIRAVQGIAYHTPYDAYRIDLDGSEFWWHESQFERIADDVITEEELYFAQLREDAVIPSKREEDGAYDVYACFDEDYIVIQPHETKMIPTGICSAFSSDYVAILKERGSTGTKGMGQRAGVVDSGYRGEWFVPITNHNNIPIVIAKQNVEEKDYCEALTGDKELTKAHIVYPYNKAICQMIMVQVPKLKVKVVSPEMIKMFKSLRGDGALGSSKK